MGDGRQSMNRIPDLCSWDGPIEARGDLLLMVGLKVVQRIGVEPAIGPGLPFSALGSFLCRRISTVAGVSFPDHLLP